MSSSVDKQATKQPESITLTEVEILRGDNINLRMTQLKQEMAGLQAEQGQFKKNVEGRLGISNLEHYLLNRKTGEGRLANRSSE